MREASNPRQVRGSVLLEALIAILIFSMGILAIVGLQGVSVKNTTDAKYRSDASNYASQIIGTMWVHRDNLSSYADTGSDIDILPSGRKIVSVSGNQVTVTIQWQLPGESTTHQYVTAATIQGST